MSPFGAELALDAGDTATFDDGLAVRVAKIEDGRCPRTAVCVWAGQIYVTLAVTNGGAPAEVALSTIERPVTSREGYVFRLVTGKVTSSQVVLTVERGQSVGGGQSDAATSTLNDPR